MPEMSELMLAAVAPMTLKRDSAATRHFVYLPAMVAMLFVPMLRAVEDAAGEATVAAIDDEPAPQAQPPRDSTTSRKEEGPSDMKPQHESGQALFKRWQNSARTDGKIPGGALGALARAVTRFIKLNPTHEQVPRLAELLERIDTSHDWTDADAVALIDDLTSIYPTLPDWAQTEAPIRAGTRLPAELAGAAWGRPAANGLRAAWLLEPRWPQYPLGTNLKASILFHNSGEKTVVFRTPDWHQYPTHQARDANGAAIDVSATEWTRLTSLVAIRLAPGEYAEVEAHAIAIGRRGADDDNWAGLRVGAWIEAKAGDEVTFQPAEVVANEDLWTAPADRRTPAEMWRAIVRERVEREGPMPAAAADREQLIRRVTLDLLGVPPTREEIARFTAYDTPRGLAKLITRLQATPRISPFAGNLASGALQFRVTPADPDAAKKPRVASGPGRYVIGDHVRLFIEQRLDGDRRVSCASIMFFSPKAQSDPPIEPHEIPLPDGLGAWAIGWERGSTVLWVAQKGVVRSYDFASPAAVNETRIEPAGIVDVPEQLRDSLRNVFQAPGSPAQQD